MSHYLIQNESNFTLILIWIEEFFKWPKRYFSKTYSLRSQLAEMSISVFKLESDNTFSIIKTQMIIRKVASGLSIIFFPRWKAADYFHVWTKAKFLAIAKVTS